MPHESASGYVNNKRESYDFHMTHIFPPSATQEDIFEGIGKPVIENVLKGWNGTIFAYGQTGSGKSEFSFHICVVYCPTARLILPVTL